MKKTMKAVVAYGKHNYRMKEVDIPALKDGEMLIQVEACGICAGDLKAYEGVSRFWGGDGMPGFCEPPFIPGHEFFGHVVALQGDVPGDFKVGDRVISEQIVPCGTCWYCRRGMYSLCEPHNVYGFKNFQNGGMAEYAVLPRSSRNYHVPEALSLEEAVLIEPFSCSLHGVRQGQIQPDDTVVVAGAGTLGLGMLQAIHADFPCRKLIALDLIDARLELAKKFGADILVNPRNVNAIDEVLRLTDGVGCDVYIEASGHPSAVQQGLDMIRKGGTFVEFSVMSGPSTIDWSIIGDAKEIVIRGSQLSPDCYPTVIQNFQSKTYHSEGVVSHCFNLTQWDKAFETAKTSESVKVILVP